jgi:hypothetical protein
MPEKCWVYWNAGALLDILVLSVFPGTAEHLILLCHNLLYGSTTCI